MKILGYIDKWHVRPGDVFEVMASSVLPDVDTDVVRLDGPDTVVPVDIEVETLGPIGEQEAVTGSHLVLDAAGHLIVPSFTFALWVLPTMPACSHRQIIASQADETVGWRLLLDHDGRLVGEVQCATGVVTVRSAVPMTARWTFVGIALDAWQGQMALFYGPTAMNLTFVRSRAAAYVEPAMATPLVLGGRQDGVSRAGGNGAFNGKLASAAAYVGAPHNTGAGALDEALPLLDRWDFGTTSGLRLRRVNAPRELLTGPHWNEGDDFARDRGGWNAVGLNEDALDDLNWTASARVHLPSDLASAVYAVRLRSWGKEEDTCYVPFFVGAGMERNRIAVVFPTFTYLAYANHRYASEAAFMADYSRINSEPVTLGPMDRFLATRPPVGPSIYDLHHDGSEVSSSSILRPVPHMQPHYRWWMTGRARHFAADLELVRWLAAQDMPFDVLTDHHIDEDPALLTAYSVVLTGSHPEYISASELDAFSAFVTAGGKLGYLGGNGFYWVTERPANEPHRIEVRRRAAGQGGWEAPPGEHILSSGRPGGLWSALGRPPEALTGVTLAGQGWTESVAYERVTNFDPRSAFLFSGIAEEALGFGGIGGGAVGDEWDAMPGEPDTTVIPLARSLPMRGEIVAGDRHHLGPWADMVLKLHGNVGGMVLSMSSIAFLSALNHDDNLSRLLENFIRHGDY